MSVWPNNLKILSRIKYIYFIPTSLFRPLDFAAMEGSTTRPWLPTPLSVLQRENLSHKIRRENSMKN
jgi:hypothetical protein